MNCNINLVFFVCFIDGTKKSRKIYNEPHPFSPPPTNKKTHRHTYIKKHKRHENK
jgi:hypothetical protein